MSIPGAASPLFLAATAAGPAGDFEISRSLRFNSGDSAYLNRTPSSAGNRKTFTFSCWVKRAALTQNQTFFSAGSSASNRSNFMFDSVNNQLRFFNLVGGSVNVQLITAQVLRDPSSWLNIVMAFDTSQSTESNRIKFYLNGVQVDNFSTTTYPSQNQDLLVNSTIEHSIGKAHHYGEYLNAFLTDVNFVDGSQLDHTSFGAFDTNGVWQAIDTSGLTFGTNGFRLKFADNSSNAALGTDSSGNSNTWTVNNLTAAAPGLATANQGFDVVTYSGNGGSQSISSLAFQPDFVWIKSRTSDDSPHLYDSIRGTPRLSSAATNSEYDNGDFSSFDSAGFTVTGGKNQTNGSSKNYVAWCWRAGGTASSNTSGTITSSVSVNTTYGFSICTYTGNNTSGATVGHSLNAVPALIILKDRSSAYNWQVYHKSFAGTSNGIVLNSNSGIDSGSGAVWNSTTPTSTVFSIGNSVGVNKSGDNYVAYVWSEVAGFSKFGSFTGASTVTVATGFKPKYILIKNTTTSGSWSIFDGARDSDGEINHRIYANESGPEGTNIVIGNFTSTGFTLTNQGNTNWNTTGDTFVYAAFAEKPDQSGIDSLVDTPSNAATPSDTGVGNEVVGNYATLNPLDGTLTLSNGNLESDRATSSWASNRSTIAVSSGKFYWEIEPTAGSGTHYMQVGIFKNAGQAINSDPGSDSDGYIYNAANGSKYNNNSSAGYGDSWAVGDIIGIALDLDAGNLYFYKNGTIQNSGTAAYTGLSGTFAAVVAQYGTCTIHSNFGQRAFAYTAPSGYKSLNTASLPTPTIADGSKYFDTKLVSGNSSTQTVSGLNFSPGFVWAKSRSHSTDHYLFDIVRGATNELKSNSTSAEGSNSGLTQFNSDGYNMGSDSSMNTSGRTYANWVWDAGTSTVTNNDGSIASQVRAQPSAGFSIVTYSGNSVSGATIGHGLNATPEFLIVKSRTKVDDWRVYSKAAGQGNYLRLQLTAGVAATGNWQSLSSTTFGLNGDSAVNSSSHTYVAYCFAPVAGYSAMGSYTGNGSTDGPFVHTGFKVAFLLLKCVDLTELWMLHDSARDPDNVVSKLLQPQSNDAEIDNVTNYSIDLLSNGFKLRSSTSRNNGSGNTYTYIAFASNPFASNGGLAR